MDGNASWTCKGNGTWEGPDPTCCESNTHTSFREAHIAVIALQMFWHALCLLACEYSHQLNGIWKWWGCYYSSICKGVFSSHSSAVNTGFVPLCSSKLCTTDHRQCPPPRDGAGRIQHCLHLPVQRRILVTSQLLYPPLYQWSTAWRYSLLHQWVKIWPYQWVAILHLQLWA